MSQIDAEIRPATEADLPAMFRIQMSAFGLSADQLSHLDPAFTTSILRHGLATGLASVAVEDGKVSGFGIAFERDDTRFLGHLFVDTVRQSSGTGRRLLESVVPGVQAPTATVGSEDLRAQALYIRAGLLPCWPVYGISGTAATAGRLPDPGLRVIEAGPVDQVWMTWDHKYSRRKRVEDATFLANDWGFRKLWLEQDGEKVGYAGVSLRYLGTDAAINTGGVVVGPVGAASPEIAARCLIAAVQWAGRQQGAESLSIDLPGPHPGIVPLLESGFRIEEQQVFFSSDPTRFGYPTLYVPVTAALY